MFNHLFDDSLLLCRIRICRYFTGGLAAMVLTPSQEISSLVLTPTAFREFQGETHLTVDSGLLIFCNHGCNGTSSYGCAETKQLGYTEINVALEEVPEDLLQTADIVYSPLNERHLRQRLSSGDKTLREIKQGEEILCDYLSCE